MIPLLDAQSSIISEGMKKQAKGFKNLTFEDPKKRLLDSLRQNSDLALIFKNHHLASDLATLLARPQGQNRISFKEFKLQAGPLVKTYNQDHLKTEYITAMATAQMADKWQELSRAELLTFRTAADGRVRDSHRPFDGITLPPSDPFWSTHYPPLDWRCRCTVIAARTAAPIKQPPPDYPPTKSPFNHNPGVTGQIYPLDSPIFSPSPAYRENTESLFGAQIWLNSKNPARAAQQALIKQAQQDGLIIDLPPKNLAKGYEGLVLRPKAGFFSKQEIKDTLPVLHQEALAGHVSTCFAIGREGQGDALYNDANSVVECKRMGFDTESSPSVNTIKSSLGKALRLSTQINHIIISLNDNVNLDVFLEVLLGRLAKRFTAQDGEENEKTLRQVVYHHKGKRFVAWAKK